MTTTADARKPRAGRWQWGKGAHESMMTTVPALLWTLREEGGEVHDSSGRAGAKLVQLADARGYVIHPTHRPGHLTGSSLSTLLGQLDFGKRYGGCIEREMNSKRTYKIRLLLDEEQLPPRPHPVVIKQAKSSPVPTAGGTGPRPAEDPKPMPPTEPTPAPEVPEQPETALVVAEPDVEVINPILAPLAVMGDADAISALLQIQNLSLSVVLTVAEMRGRLREPVVEDADERDAQAKRLADTLEENNRLRRKVNDHAETINAKAKEITALRQALKVAQNNLHAIQQNANEAGQRERNLAKLAGNQRFIAERPEAAIAARRGA